MGSYLDLPLAQPLAPERTPKVDGDCPALSVILSTPGNYELVRKTIRHLRAQTAVDCLELVIVGVSRDEFGLDEAELEVFRRYQFVEMASVPSVAEGNAAGVRVATAPVVVFAEDHSYPDPGWAAALIEAHRQPWAVVGPVIANANPGTAISWADFLLGYGPWLDPTPAGVVDHLPGHNSAYKRALLLAYGPGLVAMLGAESVLHRELRAQGHQLYLEPAARTCHVNISKWASWLPILYCTGRLFAAERASVGRWNLARRLLFTGGAPLIPLVRLRRALRDLRRSGQQRELLPSVLPVMLLGLLASAVGEAAGYISGAGHAPHQLDEHGFDRHRHVVPRDKKLVTDGQLPHREDHDSASAIATEADDPDVPRDAGESG